MSILALALLLAAPHDFVSGGALPLIVTDTANVEYEHALGDSPVSLAVHVRNEDLIAWIPFVGGYSLTGFAAGASISAYPVGTPANGAFLTAGADQWSWTLGANVPGFVSGSTHRHGIEPSLLAGIRCPIQDRWFLSPRAGVGYRFGGIEGAALTHGWRPHAEVQVGKEF
jgi:hypothetical protein